MSLTDTERKELAKEIVNQIKAADNGDCRLFNRKEVNDLRQFANHWNKHADDYRSLVELGRSFKETKSKAVCAAIWVIIPFFLIALVYGIAEQIRRLLNG